MVSLHDVIEGLKILAKHSKQGAESHLIAAEHNFIYAGASVEPDGIPSADRLRLGELGWSYDHEQRCWARFV